MIITLKYDALFWTNRELSGEFTFSTGLTVISGSNESGKSFVLEMIRFCLFGAPALRGKLETYVKLNAALVFRAAGQEYLITRDLRGARLEGGGLTVTGTKSVNAAIKRLLGFDLSVFDVVCSINQGEVERLSSMTSAQRQAMVDHVVGIEPIGKVRVEIASEARQFASNARTLEANLADPGEQPQPPEGETDLEKLKAAQDAALQSMRIVAANTAAAHEVLKQPQPVAVHHEELTLEQLQDLLVTAKTNERERSNLKSRLSDLEGYTYCDVEAHQAALAAFELYQQAKSALATVPSLTVDQARQAASRLDMVDEAARLQGVLTERADTAVTCPECAHSFAPGFDPEPLKQQLQALRLHLSGHEAAHATRAQISQSLHYPHWDRVPAWRAVPHVEVPRLNQQQITEQLRVNEHLKLQGSLAERLAAIPEADISAIELRRVKLYDYQMALRDFEAAEKFHEAKMQLQAHARALLEEHSELAELVPALNAQISLLHQYRANLEVWNQRFDTNLRLSAQILDLQTRGAELKLAVEALAAIEKHVKTYLVPSLARVSSQLLHQMTGGGRKSIQINETFDILVDGQPLETLSGSAKACANLAIRLALGQVLVSRVFSTVLADEIDGAMDDLRAENVKGTLEAFLTHIGQIIQVSHKEISGDHNIKIEGQQ